MNSHTPSDKTELKPKLRECPFCGGDAELRTGMNEFWVKCINECDGMYATKYAAVTAWNRRSDPSKPTSENTSKEEPLKSPQEKLWCAMCGIWGDHQSGTCPELHPKSQEYQCSDVHQKIQEQARKENQALNPYNTISYGITPVNLESFGNLPSSPTDKCREKYDEMIKNGHPLTGYGFWEAGWQASRKECEEEKSKFVCGVDFAHDPLIRELQVENEELRAELLETKGILESETQWAHRYFQERQALEKQIASLESAITAKDEALKAVSENWEPSYDGYAINGKTMNKVDAALHIDQLGGKAKEEKELEKELAEIRYILKEISDHGDLHFQTKDLHDFIHKRIKEILNTSTATPVSSHVGAKEPTVEDYKEALEWLEQPERILCIHKNKSCVQVDLDEENCFYGKTPLEAIQKAMSKSTDDIKFSEGVISSQKSSASSTAISTEEGSVGRQAKEVKV